MSLEYAFLSFSLKKCYSLCANFFKQNALAESEKRTELTEAVSVSEPTDDSGRINAD